MIENKLILFSSRWSNTAIQFIFNRTSSEQKEKSQSFKNISNLNQIANPLRA